MIRASRARSRYQEVCYTSCGAGAPYMAMLPYLGKRSNPFRFTTTKLSFGFILHVGLICIQIFPIEVKVCFKAKSEFTASNSQYLLRVTFNVLKRTLPKYYTNAKCWEGESWKTTWVEFCCGKLGRHIYIVVNTCQLEFHQAEK